MFVANTIELDSIDWISQFRMGEESSFSKLYTHYYSPVLNFAYHLLDCKTEAEDIFNVVFYEACKNCENLESHQSVRLFLFVRTRNYCLATLHRRQKIKNCERESLSLSKGYEDNHSEASFKEALFNKMHIEIKKLPFENQKILELVYLEGLTTDAVAVRTSLSKATVEQLIKDTLKTLRNSANPNDSPFRKMKKVKGERKNLG